VVATAAPESGLAAEVEGCGAVTPPGDAPAFAAAITRLLDDPAAYACAAAAARQRSIERWSADKVLPGFEAELLVRAGKAAAAEGQHLA
jgi:colanic acid biosynthesis glycosyl transferase WcaI